VLSKAQNDLLTQTSPGTPGGELMRRYWQPVAVARQLKPGEPLPVKLLGEDLVLFRAEDGQIGLLDRRCPHRGADLSYGRIEDGGLRCLYHGWLFAANGQCISQPCEPAKRAFPDRIQQVSYPCRQAGGLILAYLGPGEPPNIPDFPFFESAEDDRTWVTKMHHECNWLQAHEGNFDPHHLSFLHRFLDDGASTLPELNRLLVSDIAPELNVTEKAFGLRAVASRQVEGGKTYQRITNFIMPNCSTFDGLPPVNPQMEPIRDNMGYQVHWHVPIDNFSHWKYIYLFRYSGPMDREYMAGQHANIDEEFQSNRRASNRYKQDRDEMRDQSFAGMGVHYQDHDKFAVESQGVIFDRTIEHLGYSDRPTIAMRRQLLKGIAVVQEGGDPWGVWRGGEGPLSEMAVRVGLVPPGESIDALPAPSELEIGA
jgi:phthalate 4,5-dioxygenase oxygenase subunit